MRRWTFGTGLAVAFCLASGCAQGQEGSQAPANPEASQAGAKPAGSQAPAQPYENFDPGDFDERSTVIDNVWFPLKPGKRLTYEGFTVDEGEKVPHRVVFTVTDLTKVIGGVRAVVCWDQDLSGGQLQETEIVFFAQDKDGNVWHLGQYPEVYEEGKFIEAPAWLHGIGDGKAGIMMKAAPQPGTPSYSQGWAPSVSWTDRASVHQVGQSVCVPADCYEDVLVTDETSAEEVGAHHYKYYARNVGNVKVGWTGADQTQETLELVKVETLDAKGLAEARAGALKLEKNAYERSKNVYAQTPKAEQAPGAQGQ